MPNELLEMFLAEHVAADGKCSCGWDVTNYDLGREWGGPMSATEAWCHHVTKASYDWFDQHRDQYVETTGPDGEPVAFTLKRSTLLMDHTGMMLDHQREQREQYGYQYDGYEKPPRDPDDCSTPITCEEAECRNPQCLGGHFQLHLTMSVETCAGCQKPFGSEDERMVVTMQPPAGRMITDGEAIATTAAYHKACEPSEDELREHAEGLWPTPEPPEPEMRQAMACLSCGLAGETPEDHYPQESGLWDRPCPKCGEHTVWVTEANT